MRTNTKQVKPNYRGGKEIMLNYIQPMWSRQLVALMKKNLINSIDVMEYCQIIEGKKLPHLKNLTLNRVNSLYTRLLEVNHITRGER